MSHLQISSFQIFYLSILMIPNLINATLPFLLIFGLVLTFIKLSKDKEIIAIYSTGLSINELKKPFLLIIILSIILSLFLSFIFSPFTYDMYKKKEFNLRSTINFEKIDISNFIKFNKDITIDFDNKDGKFKNILINITEKDDILIYAKEGEIKQDNDKISFRLINGFKTEIKENNIENLKFDTYLANFPIDEKKIYIKSDPNTLGIFELLKSENDKKIIYLRLIDSLIIISLCIFFYINIIKKNNYKLNNQLFFIATSMTCLLIDNLFEKYIFQNMLFINILILNLFIIHFIPVLFKYTKITNEI